MDVFSRLSELRERGEPVALATVVAVRRPASARAGDRALVLADGTLIGWIGGSCAQPTVQREGLHALADGQPRLVRLSPEAGLLPPQEGVVEDVMTCHSGGGLEIYVEPFLPAPYLLIAGDSPIADALAQLAALDDDLRVLRELPAAPRPPGETRASGGDRGGDASPPPPREGAVAGGWGMTPYVVIAGQAGDDEDDLERALALDPTYVAFVGSRKRLGEVSGRLRERGVPGDLLDRVKGPAGLDIGAVTAFEIAVSIMAEIVQHRRRGPSGPRQIASTEEPIPPDGLPLSRAREMLSKKPMVAPRSGPGGGGVREAIDPVCGMRVAIPGARHVFEHAGQDYYFCCPSCRRLFAANPEQYLDAAPTLSGEGVSTDALPG
jgi:xanthine dehydrogenase accessory factor